MRRFIAYIFTTSAAFYIFFSYSSIWSTILASALLALAVAVVENGKFDKYVAKMLKQSNLSVSELDVCQLTKRLTKRNFAAMYIASFIIYTIVLETIRMVVR